MVNAIGVVPQAPVKSHQSCCTKISRCIKKVCKAILHFFKALFCCAKKKSAPPKLTTERIAQFAVMARDTVTKAYNYKITEFVGACGNVGYIEFKFSTFVIDTFGYVRTINLYSSDLDQFNFSSLSDFMGNNAEEGVNKMSMPWLTHGLDNQRGDLKIIVRRAGIDWDNQRLVLHTIKTTVAGTLMEFSEYYGQISEGRSLEDVFIEAIPNEKERNMARLIAD